MLRRCWGLTRRERRTVSLLSSNHFHRHVLIRDEALGNDAVSASWLRSTIARRPLAELDAMDQFAFDHVGQSATGGAVAGLCHFRAVKNMILERAPECRVIGFFVARRAIPN